MKIRTVLLMSGDDEEVKEEARKARKRVQHRLNPRRDYFRSYYEKNKARIVARVLKWRQENRERFLKSHREANRLWKMRNPEKAAELSRNWKKKNRRVHAQHGA